MSTGAVLLFAVLLVSAYPWLSWYQRTLCISPQGALHAQLYDETTPTESDLTTILETTLETSTYTTPLYEEMTTYTFPPLDETDEAPSFVPFGVLLPEDGGKPKKRCRCIEKKRRKVVKEIKYIPLSPSIQLDSGGHKRNFTCKCSHLRKVVKHWPSKEFIQVDITGTEDDGEHCTLGLWIN